MSDKSPGVTRREFAALGTAALAGVAWTGADARPSNRANTREQATSTIDAKKGAQMQRISRKIPIQVDGIDLAIAADIFTSDGAAEVPVIWFCMPGGSFTRRYFDLRIGEDSSRSFAVAMTARGHLVVAIDPLGVGESDMVDAPKGFDLEFLIRVHGAAIAEIDKGLAEGTLGLPPQRKAVRIGLGHSMGGMLVTLQQAAYPNFDGLVLLGSGTNGREEVLTSEERRYLGDPKGARAAVAGLAKARFGTPFVEMPGRRGAEFPFPGETDAWSEALAATRGRLIATTATFVLIPEAFAPDAAAIRVPVFIGHGDSDRPRPVHLAPGSFPSSQDITLLVLPNTKHMHFGFPSTVTLFDRLARWSAVCQTV